MVITHFFYLMFLSGNSAVYIIGCMIVSSVIALVVFRIIPYIIISIYSLASAFVIVHLTGSNYEYSVMLISGLLTILVTNFIIILSRTKTENKLTQTQKQLEEKNNELNRALTTTTAQKNDLAKINRALDCYTYTVSHNIRSPLMNITGCVYLLNQELKYSQQIDDTGNGNGNGKIKYLNQISISVENINTMIDDLLSTTKIMRINNPYDNVDMNKLILNIYQRFEFKIKTSNLLFNVQKDLPYIVCDRIKIGEVFHNLISNAIKFTTKNSTQPTIDISYLEQENLHQFCVQDNGIGIDPQHHSEIFEIFKSVDKCTELNATRGVGLNIVQTNIYDHGGRVWIESNEGFGAAFFFTIPKNLMITSVPQ